MRPGHERLRGRAGARSPSARRPRAAAASRRRPAPTARRGGCGRAARRRARRAARASAIAGVSPRWRMSSENELIVSSFATFGSATNVPDAAAAQQVPLADELVERGAHREPRDAEVDRELPLGRDRVARRRASRSGRARARASRAASSQRSRQRRLGRRRRRASRAGLRRRRTGTATRRPRARAGPPTRAAGARVDARGEERAVRARAARSSPGGLEHLGGDRRRVHAEEHVRVGAELLEHLDADRRSTAGRARRRASSKLSGRIPRISSRPGRDRPPAGRERDAVLAEHDGVAVDRGLDEVHRRRADERGDEEVARLGVEPLRRVALEDPAVAQHRHALRRASSPRPGRG